MVKVCSIFDSMPTSKTNTETRIDITNHRFGKLVAKERIVKIRPSGKYVTCYKCLCDCGNEVLYSMQYLRSGHRRDCGCEIPIVHLDITKDLNYQSKDYNNEYRRRYRKTPTGYLNNLYHGMNERNKANGFGKLPFTAKEFSDKYSKHYDYLKLFEEYKNKDFKKDYAPSIDRINPKLGYFYENMQFISWKDNKEKSYQERKFTKSAPIDMYEFKTGKFLMSFGSVSDAAKYTKLQQSNITKNLKGLRNRVGSYTFKYANKKESDIYLKIKSILNK